MKYRIVIVSVLLFTIPIGVVAQGRGERGGAAASPQTSAPIDVTGYWVSLITDNWTYRVVTPRKGDYLYLPLNPEARKIADMWDPVKDEAAGEQCKGYGPVGVMRMPTRLHITWQDPNTLKIETDTGNQTRLFHFGRTDTAGTRTWQGHSIAEWQVPGGRGRGAPSGAARTGTLKVTTTQMRPGYIHKNGVPFSENALLTEYMTVVEDKGLVILIDTLMLEDPKYLTQSFVRSAQFKKLADASGWDPQPCSAR